MSRWAQSFIAAAVCAVVAVYFGLHAADARRVRDAQRLLAAGEPAQAVNTVRPVSRAPADARAHVVRARAFGAMGAFEQADRAWRRAIERDPNNWILEFEYARMLIHAGRFADASRRIRRARALNPRMRVTPFLVGPP